MLGTSSEAFVPPVVAEVIQKSNNLGLILGIVSLVVVIIGVSGILIYKNKKKQEHEKLNEEFRKE